jgi:N-acetylglutamate synthase-like GNAT family acetyltransferase
MRVTKNINVVVCVVCESCSMRCLVVQNDVSDVSLGLRFQMRVTKSINVVVCVVCESCSMRCLVVQNDVSNVSLGLRFYPP